MAPANIRFGVFKLLLGFLLFAQLKVIQAAAQALPGHVTVAVLATAILALHHDAGGQVGQAHGNRDVAWKRLRSKLYDFEMRKQKEEQQKLEDSKTDVGWGHQIRSYVLDNSRIKDLRTNYETSATQKVLDGDLDQFIEASLKQGV